MAYGRRCGSIAATMANNFSTRFAKATGQSSLQYRKSALKPLETVR